MESAFKNRVIDIIRLIPHGKVASYGQIALYAGLPRAAREVGWILKASKDDMPWWRVLNNSGRISIEGNWEADKGLQRKLLEAEAIAIREDFTLDIEQYRWRITQEEAKKLQLPPEEIERIMQKYSL